MPFQNNAFCAILKQMIQKKKNDHGEVSVLLWLRKRIVRNVQMYIWAQASIIYLLYLLLLHLLHTQLYFPFLMTIHLCVVVHKRGGRGVDGGLLACFPTWHPSQAEKLVH